MRLDYFYNTEGENFRFYQIPALLLEEEEYSSLSENLIFRHKFSPFPSSVTLKTE